MNIYLLLYPQMTLLDLIGPLQIWNQWPGATLHLVAETMDPVRSDSAAAILPTCTIDESTDAPDILFVPGAADGVLTALSNTSIVGYLGRQGPNAGWVASVCTGSLLLGAAGLLQGYRATTHWAAMSALPSFGAEPVRSRWVIDGNRATGGGVTAGIDFGLALMAKIAGDGVARAAQLAVEYAPAPPFRSGTPDEARASTLDQVER
ncbi:MAG: DJ-1/PfpI family protein, partial [Pseudomonadota bacterium]